MKRVMVVVIVAAFALVATGCSGGPSQAEKAEFDRLALERQADYPVVIAPGVPTSIKEYVMGGPGITNADYIVTGAFTGATVVSPDAGASDLSAFTLIGQFKLHESIKGAVPSTFDVDLGMVEASLLASSAVRGAGDVVLFLSFDAKTGEWVLVDGGYALAQSDGGRLSMPFVPGAKEGQYLSGASDVADVQAMAIAFNLDPNGSLNGGLDNLGNDGVSGTQQDLIDRANDLTD